MQMCKPLLTARAVKQFGVGSSASFPGTTSKHYIILCGGALLAGSKI